MIMDERTLSILPVRRDDLPAVMGLERAGFGVNEQWTERSWQGELLGEGRTTLLARRHVPVGVIALQTVGDVADLHRLVVSPVHRRRGIGVALVTAGLRAVRHAGARTVLLEVAFDNDPAIALYQSLGFEQLAARDDYYAPGRHALILKLYDLVSWTPPTTFGLEGNA
jgi:ribosomal-protein-alanine N-acetyltransferase